MMSGWTVLIAFVTFCFGFIAGLAAMEYLDALLMGRMM